MMQQNKFLYKLGRALVGLPFVVFFFVKMFNWQPSLDSLDSMLNVWKNEVGANIFGTFISFLISIELFLLIAACVLEIIGGVLLMIGLKTRLGAWLLVLFLVPVTIFMHPFWFSEPANMIADLADFMRNVGLLGAVLLIAGKKCCCKECKNVDCGSTPGGDSYNSISMN